MVPLEVALDWLRGQQLAMENLLFELVKISSHTPDVDGNRQVAERYAAALATLGGSALAVKLEPSRQFGPHVTARSTAHPPRTLLIGHHDTVFPRATFSGMREDGELLRGPGVLDMKGGLVVIAFALGALERAGVLANIPVSVISVSDEEIGSPEGKQLVMAAAREAARALVFESGRIGDLVITQRKGTAGMKVLATGKAAHAGNAHEEGCNAIWALARFIDRAQAMTDYAAGITVNVGAVSGGIGKNTVPEQAQALLDFRFVGNQDGEKMILALKEAARSAAASVPGTQIELEGGILRPPLERSAASAQLAAQYGQAQAQCGLGSAESGLLGGGSDANTASAAGVPAIDGLGPRGRGFHTTSEYIERKTLHEKAMALIHFLIATHLA